ncbi:glycosyltransferase [Bacillus paramycoides]|uniref:glycosyltransferase n=1 Tax=Bacillus paramycoides TaxID=2026194 RepID=UPI003B967F12
MLNKHEITVSLCMIVRDEENTIARCLESVKNIVDEIIIVDMGSMDRTKEIVEKYASNIYGFSWIDDFAAARNFSFSKATQHDIPWREDLFQGFHFYDVSQSLEFRKAGYLIGIPNQANLWCIHYNGDEFDADTYEKYRKVFVEHYKDILSPS